MPEDRPARLPRPSHGRQGFTFVELIVGLAIMVMVASVVTPVLLGALDRARITTTLETFGNLYEALVDFHDDVGEWPQQITQLTTQITGAQDNICTNNYSTTGGSSDVNQWNGPYLANLVTANGLPVPIGRIRNQFSRLPTTGTNTLTQIRVVVDSVAVEDAEEINLQIEADGSGTGGLVFWSDAGEGLTTLTIAIPATGC